MIDPLNKNYSMALNFFSNLPAKLNNTITAPASIMNHLHCAVSQLDGLPPDDQHELVRQNAHIILKLIADRAAKATTTKDIATLKTGFIQIWETLHDRNSEATEAAVTALQGKLAFTGPEFPAECTRTSAPQPQRIEVRELAYA